MNDEMRAEDSSDEAIVCRVLKGEVDAFTHLISRHKLSVSITVRRYVKDADDADDVIQQVFIKAWKMLGQWQAKSPFAHWLSKVAVNTCYDHLRNRSCRPETSFSRLSEAEQQWLEDVMTTPDTVSTDSHAARELVARAMQMIKPKNRILVDLVEIQGKTGKEISQLTGWSLPLVKVRAFRARQELKHVLKKLMKNGTLPVGKWHEERP